MCSSAAQQKRWFAKRPARCCLPEIKISGSRCLDNNYSGFLDRINGDKGYFKENCRLATHKEQANNMSRNRYLEFNVERLTISQWADKIGVKYVTLNTRIHRGWDVERALTTK